MRCINDPPPTLNGITSTFLLQHNSLLVVVATFIQLPVVSLSCFCFVLPTHTYSPVNSMEPGTFDKYYNDFVEWSHGDLRRPVLILVCGMLLFNLPTLVYKIRMVLRTILYYAFCWDKSYKKPQDPGSIFGPYLSQDLPVQKKTIYFVRHGESTWNDTFNKGKHRSVIVFVLGFFPGLIKALLYEAYLLLSGKLDRYVRIFGRYDRMHSLLFANILFLRIHSAGFMMLHCHI